MDPDKALADLRKALTEFSRLVDGGFDDKFIIEAAGELADAIEALDGWMSKGGFPPRAWTQRAL